MQNKKYGHDLGHRVSTPRLISGNDTLQKMVAAKPEWERLYYGKLLESEPD